MLFVSALTTAEHGETIFSDIRYDLEEARRVADDLRRQPDLYQPDSIQILDGVNMLPVLI